MQSDLGLILKVVVVVVDTLMKLRLPLFHYYYINIEVI